MSYFGEPAHIFHFLGFCKTMVAIYEIRVSKNRNFACTLAAYVCVTEVEIYGKMSESSTIATTK